MTAPLTRDEQVSMLLAATQVLRGQGWTKAAVRVTRGGTLDVDVSVEGDKVARPQFSSGRGK